MVLARSRSASPILDEGSGGQIGVRCCQGYSGFRLVEAVVDSGAEESVEPPNDFPG